MTQYISNNTSPSIDRDKWIQILELFKKDKKNIWIDLLLMFFYQPRHEASVKMISRQYAMSADTVRILLENISNQVFNCIQGADPIKTSPQKLELFFDIRQEKEEILTLRQQLVLALRIFLIDSLISAYRMPVLSNGLNNDNSEELYKWQTFAKYRNKPTKEILGFMCSPCKENNFLNWRIKEHIQKALNEHHQEIIECFEILRNTSGGFYEKFSSFVASGRTFLSKEAAASILKENVASEFLTFVNPTENVLYRWSIYELICKYLGYKPDKDTPYDRYIEILQEITEREAEDKELITKIKSETEEYFWSPLLNSQDVIWQTQNHIRQSFPKNWLQKLYEKALKQKHWVLVFESWTKNYTKSVTTFLDMFAEDKTSEDIDDATKDLLLRVKDNSISSNGQGMYSYDEYNNILNHWDEIYNILKRNVLADTISMDDYKRLNDLIQPLLSKRKPSAYHRIWAAVFPHKLCTIIERSAFNNTYETIRKIDDSLPPLKDTWVESNMVLMDYFKDKVNFKEEYHRPIFAWYLKENLHIDELDSNMKRYIELLKANRNLILTGAPGTGKTYLAKKIAEAMGDSTPGFVQFHPSMDYTDFVEGLRPTPETNSFERKDGVFKMFCKEALSGIRFSDFDIAYDAFISHLLDLPETAKMVKIKTPKSGAEFGVTVNSKLNLNLHTGENFQLQGVLKRDDLKKSFSGERIYDYWKGYYEGVLNHLKEAYNLKDAQHGFNQGNKVFIIDEINRGELSKIFGELFYSIEPSYRGKNHRVHTQYQNLVPQGDPFEDGFFVPENVFIIGTMNDIDRGVESIDFAIRRRFGWLEIKPEDRKDMLAELIPEYSDDAAKVMESINKVLTRDEIGLPKAYEIGPAYFLKLREYDGEFQKLWDYNIKGLLYEYLRGDRSIDAKMDILKESFFKALNC